ncbi:metalloregulator ArsR/SmtB family transcription factor [Eubacteriaceae bacterium ES2]|nr:metalloregulator ArsR/SmtB family transcription factor [Eubacteriaceae bacterium ES2]
MKIIEVFKVLSDLNRLRILNLLYEKELCVCEIEYILEISQSNLSKHLRQMNKMGFLESHRENKFNFYKISPSVFEEYPFLVDVFEKDLAKDEDLSVELGKLRDYKKSDQSCYTITAVMK